MAPMIVLRIQESYWYPKHCGILGQIAITVMDSYDMFGYSCLAISGRRFDQWGSLRATYIHFRVGVEWYFGNSPEKLERLCKRLYADIR
jgi:hypothetical protein